MNNNSKFSPSPKILPSSGKVLIQEQQHSPEPGLLFVGLVTLMVFRNMLLVLVVGQRASQLHSSWRWLAGWCFNLTSREYNFSIMSDPSPDSLGLGQLTQACQHKAKVTSKKYLISRCSYEFSRLSLPSPPLIFFSLLGYLFPVGDSTSPSHHPSRWC